MDTKGWKKAETGKAHYFIGPVVAICGFRIMNALPARPTDRRCPMCERKLMGQVFASERGETTTSIVGIITGALVACCVLLLLLFALAPKTPAPSPLFLFGNSTGDSLTVTVKCGGPDTLRVIFLGRAGDGKLYTRKPLAVAPGQTLVMSDRADVLRGCRVIDSRKEIP